MTLPLKRGGEPLGVAVLLRADGEPPSEETLAFLSELSVQLAIAVGNARVYAEAMREKVQNHLLFELGTKISVSLDTGQLLEQILDLVFQVVRYDAAGIYLIDPDTQWINRQTIRGYEPHRDDAVRLKVGRGLIGWVAKTGREVIVPDVTKDPRYVNARDGTRSEMVAPLRVGAEVIGAFNVESDEPDAYGEEDMELLMTFASQAAVAIERTGSMPRCWKALTEEEVSIADIQRLLPERDPEVLLQIAGAVRLRDGRRRPHDYADRGRAPGNRSGTISVNPRGAHHGLPERP
jgi:GAF domain-containing protein